MSKSELSKLMVDGAEIAVRHTSGANPGIVWLGGYRSDMAGTKAEALADWGMQNGLAVTRHDYSGHGESGGNFELGTISRWLNESLAVLRHFTTGKQILVGSSMGGWIALRMIQELIKSGEQNRVSGMVLLAPAPDFTSELIEPQLTEVQKQELHETGRFLEPSEYSSEPNMFTRKLLEDGRNNRVLTGTIDTYCPVHILQGMKDDAVPYAHAMRLVEHLPSDDVTLTLIRDGDHRLSRPQDLELMISTVAAIHKRSEE